MKYSIFFAFFLIATLPAPLAAKEKGKFSLITEDLATPHLQSTSSRRNYYYHHNIPLDKIWNKFADGIGAKNSKAGGGLSNALTTLRDIRSQHPENTAYHKQWFENQNKVFAAQTYNADATYPPIEPTGDHLPSRAISDYKYQLASWNFYLQNYDDALSIYREIVEDLTAPTRPIAAYMVARTLAYNEDYTESFKEIDLILQDKTLQSVHNMADNYRFILNYPYTRFSKKTTNEQSLMFLTWLAKIVTVNPAKNADIQLGIQNYYDAMQHINFFFPLVDKETKRVDWWLTDTMPKTPKMRAVKVLSATNELVDWMQAKWALNKFDANWLFALHPDDDTPYWEQNKNIVNHAWQRWQNDDGLEWLDIVIKRIHPKNPLTKSVLAQALPIIENTNEPKTIERAILRKSLTTHSIRLHLGLKNYPEALKILHIKPSNELQQSRYYQQDNNVTNTLRWLVYTGEYTLAREILANKKIANSRDYNLIFWRLLLAPTWDRVLHAYKPFTRYHSNYPNALFSTMTSTFSTKGLFTIAENKKLNLSTRQSVALTVLVRAMMLNDSVNIDKYAILAAELNLEIRDQILNAVSGNNEEKYIDFLLRQPRTSPIPYLSGNMTKESYSKIDSYDPNNRNWWCRYNYDGIENGLFRHVWWELVRSQHRYLNIDGIQSPTAKHYSNELEAFLSKHPYTQFIDQDEIKKLENIPSAPQYLSEKIIDRENSIQFRSLQSAEQQQLNAANLHYAVRTTRYGCKHNGPHGEYSRKAFRLLHKNYSSSIWAKNTPYWFNIGHRH